MGTDLRTRQERIREVSPPQATQKDMQRDYSSGAGREVVFAVLRVATSASLWYQVVRYNSNPPVEDDVAAVGEFKLAYPPPGVQYGQFVPFVRPLLDATTRLPITQNPNTDEEREAFEAAMEAETLRSVFYPVEVKQSGGVTVLITHLWVDPNPDFYDEQAETSEGSSA